MFSALRRRNFALLWFGQLISLIGDWVLFIALPFYVFALTGSALATGAMFIAQTLPRLFLGSLAGVFVDRWNRRRTMIVADVSRALILLLLLLVHSRDLVWIVYVVAFVETSISQFFVPAKSAIIPSLVGEKDLVAANSLDAFSDSVTRLVGPGLGGVMLGLLGITSVAFIDSGSYLFSAVMILLISLPATAPREAIIEGHRQTTCSINRRSTRSLKGDKGYTQSTIRATMGSIWREWLDGLQLVRKERLLAGLFIVTGILMINQGIINVLLVVFVKTVLHGDALVLGWLITAQGIGGLLGAFLLGQVSKVVRPGYLIAFSFLIAGALLLLIVNIPILLLALVLIAVIGIAVIGFFVTTQTLLQSGTADKYRGRVFGAYGTTNALLMLVGMAFAASLGDILGVVILMNIAGALMLLAGGAAMILLRSAKMFTRPGNIRPIEGVEVKVE